MICEKCLSSNCRVDIVIDNINTNNTSLLRKIGRLLLIINTCGLWLFIPSRKSNSKINNCKLLVCNNCGHTKKINEMK